MVQSGERTATQTDQTWASWSPAGGREVLCRRGAWGLVVHSADAVRPVGLSYLVKSFARSLNSWFIFFFLKDLCENVLRAFVCFNLTVTCVVLPLPVCLCVPLTCESTETAQVSFRVVNCLVFN